MFTAFFVEFERCDSEDQGHPPSDCEDPLGGADPLLVAPRSRFVREDDITIEIISSRWPQQSPSTTRLAVPERSHCNASSPGHSEEPQDVNTSPANPIQPPSPVLCVDCGLPFKDSEELAPHRRAHHPFSPRWQCAYCSRVYRNEAYLKQHTLTHMGEWPLWCDMCPERFRCKETLQKHILSHFQPEPTAPACEDGGDSPSDPATGRTYKCPKCKISFSNFVSMAAHCKAHKRMKKAERLSINFRNRLPPPPTSMPS